MGCHDWNGTDGLTALFLAIFSFLALGSLALFELGACGGSECGKILLTKRSHGPETLEGRHAGHLFGHVLDHFKALDQLGDFLDLASGAFGDAAAT